jgi:hypothetical protein
MYAACSAYGAGGPAAWTPLTPGNLVTWWSAGLTFCFEDDAGTDTCENADGVAVLQDRSGLAQNLTQTTAASRPQFESAGWNGTQPSALFDGAGDVLQRTSGTLLTSFAGSDTAFTVFLTLQSTTATLNQSILCWDNSTPGNELITVRTDNTGNNLLRVQRTDTAAATVTRTGTIALTTSRRRIVVFFSGTSVTTWVDSVVDINNLAMDVGTLTTLNRFRFGNGTAGSFAGRIAECLVYTGDKSAHVANYQTYSVATWGG